MNRQNWRFALGVGFAACCGLLLAAVPGKFTIVNALTGFQVNGAAGSSGQVLCSDGTYFDTACSAGTGTITGVTASAPLTGGGTSGTVTVGLGTTGTAGTYAYPTSVTTDAWGRISSITAGSNPIGAGLQSGTNGYFRDSPDGTIENFINISGLPNDNTYHDYTLPQANTTLLAGIACSIDRPGGNPAQIGARAGSTLASIQLLSNTGGSGTLINASCTVTGK